MQSIWENIKGKTHGLLRWSQHYTQIDMVYLFRNGFWVSFGQVAASLCSLVMAISFARLVSKDVYGTYKFILSVTAILGSLSLSGIGVVVTRAIARRADGTLMYGFRMALKWGLITFLIGAGIAVYYFFKDNTVIALSLIVAAVLLPLSQGFSLYDGFFRGRKDFRVATYYGIWSQIGVTICLVIAMFLNAGVVSLIVIYFTVNLAFDIAFFITAARMIQNNEVDIEALNFSKHASLINIFGTIGDQFDNVIIFHNLGPVPLSIYSYAVAVPDQIIGIFKNIQGVMMPRFSEVSKEDIRAGFMRKMILLGGFLALCTGGYILIAPWVYRFLFPNYISSIGLSQLYAVVIFLTVGILPAAIFSAHLSVKTSYIITVISNVIRIALMAILIIPYGIWGVVLAQIISKIITVVISVVAVQRTSFA